MVMYVARLLKNLRLFGRLVGAIGLLMLSACNSEIYVRDGVTDGDTFYLAERALTDDDRINQPDGWLAPQGDVQGVHAPSNVENRDVRLHSGQEGGRR